MRLYFFLKLVAGLSLNRWCAAICGALTIDMAMAPAFFSHRAAMNPTLSLGRAKASSLLRPLGVALLIALTGCDQLGLETPQKAAERQQADAKAVGSACRHAMRAIEDCYTLNPKADKASVFAGWREMDEYMRENKLDGVTPVVPRPPPPGASKPSAPAVIDEEEETETPASGKRGKAKGH